MAASEAAAVGLQRPLCGWNAITAREVARVASFSSGTNFSVEQRLALTPSSNGAFPAGMRADAKIHAC